MRLPTRVHGMLDYALGALMVAAPWVFGFARGGAETWVPVGIGAVVVAYSLVTDYEMGPARRLPVATHLWLDAIAGVLLAVSPWLFGFDTLVWTPHVVLGLLQVSMAGITNTVPGYDRRRAARG